MLRCLIVSQIETFGSMERREKIEFILEQVCAICYILYDTVALRMRVCLWLQMRMGLLKKDFIRTQIISKKISTKFFTEPGTEVCPPLN